MPETMSPREVELKPCPFCGGEAEIIHIDDGENEGGSCVCCKKCQASGNVEFEFKENFVSNWNRRAAIASSVDHAELARLAEEAIAQKGRWDEIYHINLFNAAANPATVLALLAEVAALRERNAAADRIITQQSGCADEQTKRATEAERKLAEAVGLLRRIDRTYADMEDGNGNHPTELRKVRAFLSKEAERG